MTKRKLTIYISALIAFFVLFVLYLWIASNSAEQTKTQRITESISISSTQMEKNLEYHAKDLLFEFQKYQNQNLKDIEALAAAASQQKISGKQIYIVDAAGTVYGNGNGSELENRKLQASVLDSARNLGYAAIGMREWTSQDQHIGFVVPLEDGTCYFLILYTPKEYVTFLVSGIPLYSRQLSLFDEWGNLIGTLEEDVSEQDSQLLTSLSDGAGLYSSNRLDSNFKRSTTERYNVYLPVSQPASWFVGTSINYADYANVRSVLPLSSLIVAAILVLTIVIVIVLDIINDREKKKELFLVSNLDQLTGLCNNAGMQETVQSYMKKTPVAGYSFVCMDTIAFSRINTMFGYSIGDMLLRIIADVIKENYFCGTRTNADRFAFLAKGHEYIVPNLESILYDAIEKRLGSEYIQMINFKFGVYPITDLKSTFREIYDGAQLALKDAKKQSGQKLVTYDKELKVSMELHKNIEVHMVHALSKEEFLVYVQPQLDMPGEWCRRGETLIRWRSEYMGFLPPDQFISIFEENGFIVETDFYMLSRAMQLILDQLKDGVEPVTLAVNQSKVTISFPNYYERLEALIQQYQIPLRYIELEITESTLENDWNIIVPLIHRIKKLGFSIAMDDFGSGFSSLSTLRILPIDILKIDKGFLQESDSSERSRVIIRNIINMAKELDIKVVCEGAETQEQINFLKEAGCDVIQGYYYSRPIPIEEFVEKYVGR